MGDNNVEPSVVSEDDGHKILDALRLAAFSAKDQRELDTLKALTEMVGIAAEMMVGIAADTGPRGHVPSEERMRREAELLAKWPEACRRAVSARYPCQMT